MDLSGESIDKNNVLNSFVWKVLERLCSQGINLVVQIVLARLLLPSDFGSLAIIMAITNYVSIFVQSGLATAIVQKKNLGSKDVNTLFTSSLVIAFFMYIGLYILSPIITQVYDMPELIWPLRVVSLVLFLNAINSVQMALFTRNMQFKQIFLRSVIAVPLSGLIGIILAYIGWGLWALIAYTLINMLLTVIVMALTSNYCLRFTFCWESAKILYSFSVKILLSSLVSGFGDTLRTLVIGKKYDINDLAYYDKSYTYSSYFVQIINSSVASVLLPTFSRRQDDMNVVLAMARRSVQVISFFVIPFLTLIACIAHPLVNLLLTDIWLPCVPFLVIFCILRIPGCLTSVDKQVYYSLGNSSINLKYEIFLLAVNIATLLVTVNIGVYAMALGYMGIEILGGIVLCVISAKFYGYSLKDRFTDIIKPIINSIIMCFILSMAHLEFSLDIITIIVKLFVGLLLYLILCVITKDKNIRQLIRFSRKLH